jgi:segregation and condensation protein B
VSDRAPSAEPDGATRQEPAARFTLQQLSSALARLRGPASKKTPPPEDTPTVAVEAQEPLADDEALPVTPRSIVEGMLFVGRPDGRPLTSRELASHISDVTPDEVDALVAELNEAYRQDGAAYEIAPDGPGYRLQLRSDLAPLRARFRGRVRTAKLTPAAVEVLSVIAYRQPITSEEIARLRGAQSQGILQQLVRRQLVRIDRPAEAPRTPRYHTTDRFNALFGVTSAADLPQDEDLDDS